MLLPLNRSATRRKLLQYVGTAGALLAAPQLMVRAAFGKAEMMGAQSASHFRFMLGGFEITTIRDGARVLDGPYPIFGGKQSEQDVHALLKENYLPEKQFSLGFTPTIVNTGSQLVLFDTGNGARGRQAGLGQLRQVLGQAGYTPEQIDVVVITHMHPDHIGGLMEDGQPAFPNARYVTGATEYNFWSADERMSGKTEGVAKLVGANVKPLAEKISFIEDGGDVVAGIAAINAFGHTPGHMIYHVASNGRRLIIAADTANHFVVALQRPDWEVVFDVDKAMAAATRRRVFDMIATDRMPFIGYHMPYPSVGFVEKHGVGFRYIANSYQVEL